jgi:hypothetical protein
MVCVECGLGLCVVEGRIGEYAGGAGANASARVLCVLRCVLRAAMLRLLRRTRSNL